MDFKARYEMDKDAEQHGREVEFGDGAKLIIARASNPDAQKLREKLMKPYERPGFRTKKVSDEDQRKITAKVIAFACVKGWSGVSVKGLEGMLQEKYSITIPADKLEEAPYSPQLCEALLLEFDDFYRDVLLCTTDEDLFRAEQVEADKGD